MRTLLIAAFFALGFLMACDSSGPNCKPREEACEGLILCFCLDLFDSCPVGECPDQRAEGEPVIEYEYCYENEECIPVLDSYGDLKHIYQIEN